MHGMHDNACNEVDVWFSLESEGELLPMCKLKNEKKLKNSSCVSLPCYRKRSSTMKIITSFVCFGISEEDEVNINNLNAVLLSLTCISALFHS